MRIWKAPTQQDIFLGDVGMRRLNIQDSAFLTVETDESPTHVAGLQILQLPPRSSERFMVYGTCHCFYRQQPLRPKSHL